MIRDADIVSRYLEDAAHYPGGHADAIARPADVQEVAALVADAPRILAVGAQSSLTGGATPHGGLLISSERLQAFEVAGEHVRAGAGVTLDFLQQRLAEQDMWFPPVPTFLGATVGGAVSTNAAGAATFKYGPVRSWVDALTVVLATGDILPIARGEIAAAPDGFFEIETSDGLIRAHVPCFTMPNVPKCSAGYFAAPGMDLIDLFIGAEGTLGVIVDATLRIRPRPAATCWALVPVVDEDAAIELVHDLRDAAQQTSARRGDDDVDVAAIEHVDARSLQVIREDGIHRKLNIAVPEHASVILLVQLELAELSTDQDLWSELANTRTAPATRGPLTRFCRLLDRHRVLDDTEIALPGNRARAAAFIELREAVPAGVNRRVAQARTNIDARIHKTAADMIVPFDQFGPMMHRTRQLFVDRGLDLAVWGHISDGNVHPNVIPHSLNDVERGREAILELGRIVIAMGGSPLAEHGVGRNPVKQHLLRMLYGDSGIAGMRLLKQSLDPQGKLSPGVLFEEC